MSLRALAIVATRGSTNNLFQVATLVRAATALELVVQVRFEEDALRKLERSRVNVPEWSAAYAPIQDQIEERLRAADFVDLETFLRDAKEHGDHVTFWAAAETLSATGLQLTQLTPLLDGQIDETAFQAATESADAVLRF